MLLFKQYAVLAVEAMTRVMRTVSEVEVCNCLLQNGNLLRHGLPQSAGSRLCFLTDLETCFRSLLLDLCLFFSMGEDRFSFFFESLGKKAFREL